MYIRQQRNSGWSLKHALIGIGSAIATLLFFVWLIHINTGERRIVAVAERMIESQCATWAECRVSDEGTKCWIIDTNDTIVLHVLSDDEMPTRSEIDLICEDIYIQRSTI